MPRITSYGSGIIKYRKQNNFKRRISPVFDAIARRTYKSYNFSNALSIYERRQTLGRPITPNTVVSPQTPQELLFGPTQQRDNRRAHLTSSVVIEGIYKFVVPRVTSKNIHQRHRVCVKHAHVKTNPKDQPNLPKLFSSVMRATSKKLRFFRNSSALFSETTKDNSMNFVIHYFFYRESCMLKMTIDSQFPIAPIQIGHNSLKYINTNTKFCICH
ncbi:hypothetical protein FF38_06277 [Lucilia cuprina]|uniref:Uncharacterized protein n=1 Tax=Lucilia cuprina TaxID=7375 RepID=A0A0L0C2T6_LUCCU|nr:hypothetical protein FF38_06277 [Lucilia cuprina]